MFLEDIFQFYSRFSPSFTVETSPGYGLIERNFTAIFFLVLYVAMLEYFPEFQKKNQYLHNRPKLLKAIFLIWNIFLASYSVVSFIFFACQMFHMMITEEDFSFFFVSCGIGERLYQPPAIFWVYLFAVSKYFELFDTFLLILKRPEREIKFLHKFHHISVFIMGWYSYFWKFTGASLTPITNTFVHSFMYTYYALSVFYRPSFGILITIIQIVQMIFGCYFIGAWWYFQLTYGCNEGKVQMFCGSMFVVAYSTYLYLFVDFFMKKYLKKQVKSA